VQREDWENGKKTRSSKRDYSDVSINDSTSVIWKITRKYLNCGESYCVLGEMSDGKCIRGVPVPSCVVMWVTWQLDTWRTGAITFCDVGVHGNWIRGVAGTSIMVI
jgi:hypothetical protein